MTRARPRRRGTAEIPGSANGVARLIPHRGRPEHRSVLAALDAAIARSVLRRIISAYVLIPISEQ